MGARARFARSQSEEGEIGPRLPKIRAIVLSAFRLVSIMAPSLLFAEEAVGEHSDNSSSSVNKRASCAIYKTKFENFVSKVYKTCRPQHETSSICFFSS